MAGWRPRRVAEMVHRELAQRLRLEIKDPDLTPISITGVDVTGDLSRATVHYLPLGGGDVPQSLADALDRAARKLRGPVGRSLRLRTAPELVFVVDEHTEAAARMTALLDEIGEELQARGGEE